MEAIGLLASIVQLVEAIRPVFEYVKDVRDGPAQRAEIVANVAALTALLGVLETQSAVIRTNAGPLFTAIQGLTAPLDELRDLLERLGRKVQDPKTAGQKLKGRLTWTLDKADVRELLFKVERVKTLVTLAIQNDHLALSLAIQGDIKGVFSEASAISGKVTGVGHKVDHVSVQVASVSSDVSAAAEKIRDVGFRIDDVSRHMEPLAAGVLQVHGHTINADIRAFSQWICSINFQATEESFFSRCTRGTGAWFLEHPKFKEWTVGDNSRLLWCPGGPGVGKTMLASLVVKHMRNVYPHAGVACVFCDYKQEGTLTAPELVASILRQLMLGRSVIPESIRKLYNDFNAGYPRPSDLTTLTGALEAQVRLYPRVYLIVDALDECSTLDATRDHFVSTIRSLATHNHVHLLITSRDVLDLSQQFIGESCIIIGAHEDDLRAYIIHRLDTEHRLKRLVKADADLRNAIVEQVIEKAAGMFLLARLHVDSLASKLNLKSLRAALTTLPKELHGSYNETMLRVRAQADEESALAFRVFLWLTYTKALLTVGQLEHALAVSTDMNDMEYDTIVTVNILTSLCAGLVVVEDERSDSIVRFVHYTTQEYFEGEGNTLFPVAHLEITTTCLVYLSFDTFGHKSYDRKLESQQFPLVQYAATYWGDHARECEEILCTAHAQWILEFLRATRKVACTAHYAFVGPGAYLGAHVLARFGLPRLMAMLLDENTPLDILDSTGCTPLFYATSYDHFPVVKLLVERATRVNQLSSQGYILNPNCTGDKNETPLHYAAQHKSIEITQLLLQLPGLNPNIQDAYCGEGTGRTPLSYLAESGPAEIVDLLLQRTKADPNSANFLGRTPLSYAAQAGNLEVVLLLLKHPDIQPDWCSERGRGRDATPLAYAAEQGHLNIVEKLIEREDIDVNATEADGQTPLACAAEGGHHRIIEALLRHPKIQPDVGDNWGRTPDPPIHPAIIPAARHGHLDILNLLLECKDVDPNCLDLQGRTALSYAAENGHLEVVKLLLRIPTIQADCTSKDPGSTGRTPLSYAAYRAQVDIVALLLGRMDVDPNAQDSSLRTPTSYAADTSRQLILIKLLLSHPDIKPALPDDIARTPLMYFAHYASTSSVDSAVEKLLLTHYANDANVSHMYGGGMLILAAKRGYSSIVQLLLDVQGIAPDPKDGELRTPLSWAAGKGHIDTVNCLILRDSDPNSTDTNQCTPLCHAAKGNHLDIVQAFLALPNIQAAHADKDQFTPLIHSFFVYSYSTREAYKATELLLQHYVNDPQLVKIHGGAMLIVAAGTGNSEMVLHLLSVHHIVPDFKDRDLRTALSWAAENGHSDIVGLLLRRTDVDPNSRDRNDYTPIHYARKKGHTGIEALLRQRGVVEELNPGNVGILGTADYDDCEDMWETLFTMGSRNDVFQSQGG
ncbi:ankyrin repeat-containing domain protein [Mycena rebaudengoi]|nr:ankyrin repeat-containing domain protein [Mycena rebaudengoi]